MGEAASLSYAKMIRANAGCTSKKCEIDPLSLVSFFWHESGWRASAIGDSGRAIGLGQSWSWLYSSECKKDRKSKACEGKRVALLNPANNIWVNSWAIPIILSAAA